MRFKKFIVEAEPVAPVSAAPTAPAAPSAKPAPTPVTPAPETPKEEFSPQVKELAKKLDPKNDLTIGSLDSLIQQIEQHGTEATVPQVVPAKPEEATPEQAQKAMDMPVGTAGDAPDLNKTKQEAIKKLSQKLNSLKLDNIGEGTAKQIKDIVLKKVTNKEPVTIDDIKNTLKQQNPSFEHTQVTDGAIQYVLDQIKNEVNTASASQAEFASKKYNLLMKKAFLESLSLMNELEGFKPSQKTYADYTAAGGTGSEEEFNNAKNAADKNVTPPATADPSGPPASPTAAKPPVDPKNKDAVMAAIEEFAKGKDPQEVIKALGEIKKYRAGAGDDAQRQIMQSILDMLKETPNESKNFILALKFLKSVKETAPKTDTGTGTEASPEASPPQKEELPENKTPAPYASMMGDPEVISGLSTLFKTALNLVVWVVSTENANAGAILQSINGGISTKLDSINDMVKQGKANADDLNKQLKSSFKEMQNAEKTMNGIYSKIKEKAQANGKNPEELIADARKTRNIDDLKKNIQDKALNTELDKYKAKAKVDPNFIQSIKKSFGANFDSLLASATNSTDPKNKESSKTLITSIKKYLDNEGAANYPYLSEMVEERKQDQVIKKSLIEIKANTASILQMKPDQVEKLKENTKTGELDTYFVAENEMNDCLNTLSEMIFRIKRKLDVKDLQSKTKLSARTINNWIKSVKENPYNADVIKAIGNQQAQ